MDHLRYFVFGFIWRSRENQTASPFIIHYELLLNHSAPLLIEHPHDWKTDEILRNVDECGTATIM